MKILVLRSAERILHTRLNMLWTVVTTDTQTMILIEEKERQQQPIKMENKSSKSSKSRLIELDRTQVQSKHRSATRAMSAQSSRLLTRVRTTHWHFTLRSTKISWRKTSLQSHLSRDTRFRRITGQKWSIGWLKLQLPSSVPPEPISLQWQSLTLTWGRIRASSNWITQLSMQLVLPLCTWPQNMRTSTLFTLKSCLRRSLTALSPRSRF